MILTEEVEVKWNPNTKEHYMERGYKFTKHRDVFIVKTNDLPIGSRTIIEVECDYCNKTQKREYGVIIKSITNCILNSYSCNKCKGFKSKAQDKEKQKRGLLQRGDSGYWKFKENLIAEFNKYFSRYQTVTGMSRRDYNLYDQININCGSLQSFIAELGYTWDEVSNIKPLNYYKDFENVKDTIEEFIDTNNRFPLWEELNRDLKIQIKDITFHGGIKEIKRRLNYNTEDALIDDSGYQNKSGIEYIVAQYLIKNNIKYKRDVEPFENRKISCDFYLEDVDGNIYYVEVWGFRERDESHIGKRYSNNKREKIELYEQSNLNLTSIKYEDLQRLTYKEIQEYLKVNLSFLTNKELIIFDDVNYLIPNKLSDEDIFKSVISFSDIPNQLPPQKILYDAGLHSYVSQIKKRFGSYQKFADTYNVKLSNMARARN